MPAPPELDQRGRQIRSPEVFWQPDAYHHGSGNRHVRISAEIAINLCGEGVYGNQILLSGKGPGTVEYLFNHPRERVSDHQLLEQSDGEDRYSERQARCTRAARQTQGPKLRQQIRRSQNGSGDQMWEEQHKAGKSADPPLERITPAIDVHHIGDQREGHERDAKRQGQRMRLVPASRSAQERNCRKRPCT